jgi:hypothetical protein
VRFFQPEDEQDMARCMLLMARDRGLRDQLARNATSLVANFAWDQKKEVYLGLVDGLTGSKGAVRKGTA